MGTQTTITVRRSNTTVLAASFLSNIGELPNTYIDDGFWLLHLWGSGDGGTFFYFALSSVDADGTSNKTLIATGSQTSMVGFSATQTMNSDSLFIPATTLADSTKRLILDIYTVHQGGNRTASLEFRNTTLSHVHTSFEVIGNTGPTGPTGPGFTTINDPADFRILTATGTSPNQAQASSNLTWNGSLLNVVGDVSANVYNGPGGTAGAPHYTFSDDRTTGLFFPSAGTFGITASGVERARIDASGLSIGTRASPAYNLDVSGTGRVGGVLLSNNNVSNISNAYVVRTSSTFNPTVFGNIQLWLDAADTGTITFSSGSNISGWADKSGRGCNASTINGTPTLVSNSLNGNPGVFFNGGANMRGSASNTGTVLTGFLVANVSNTTPGSTRIVSLGQIGTGDWQSLERTGLFARRSTSQLMTLRNLADLGFADISFNTGLLATSVYTGSSNTFYVNGTAGTSAASSGSFGYSAYGIGKDPGNDTNFYIGSVYEVLIYNTSISTVDRQTIEGYLTWKWGLQSFLPAGHPYALVSPPVTISNVGTFSTDTNFNLTVATSNQIRLQGPTQWRQITQDVSATSLALGTNAYSTYYRISNSGFNALTLPSLTSNDRGVQWNLQNDTSTNLSVTLTYLGGSGIVSPLSLPSFTNETIVWNGSNYRQQLGDSFISNASNTRLLISDGTTTNASAQSNLTWNGSLLDVSGSGQIGNILLSNYNISNIATASFARNVGTFSPTEISNLSLWHDANGASNFTFSSGSNIASWLNKASTGGSATVSGTPIYGTDPAKSTTAVVFTSGSNAIFDTPSVFTDTGGRTIITVSRLTAGANNHSVLSRGPASPEMNIRYTNDGGQSIYTINNGALRGLANNSTSGIRGLIETSSLLLVYVNGTNGLSNATSVSYSALTNSSFRLGRWSTGPIFEGYMTEILAFSRALTVAEYQRVEGYLAWKWNYVSDLPAGHPFKAAPPSPATVNLSNIGSLTSDTDFNLLATAPNQIRLQAPTQWRQITQDVSATSLALGTNAYSTYYYISNAGLNLITLPSLTSNDRGVQWNLQNDTSSNLDISLTYLGGSGIPSPTTIPATSRRTIVWTGTTFKLGY
jgi:hypothetical protein